MILAIVVTYFPEEKLLKENVNAFIDSVDKVLIWENIELRMAVCKEQWIQSSANDGPRLLLRELFLLSETNNT